MLNQRHRELAPNLNPAWRANTRGEQHGEPGGDRPGAHATVVAAIMAAARNDEAGVGVAYGAAIGAHWIENGNAPILSAMRHYDIANHSWGAAGRFTLLGPLPALVDATRRGRNGLGTVIVTAAGNQRADGHNTNYSNMGNSGTNITVGAVAQHGGVPALQQRFSTPGANVLVSAPGAELVTGVDAPDVLLTGTSFAAPIVSGVVALMLEANPALGYRDVQHILALSARKVDDEGSDWQVNGAGNWNGGGMLVSHDYGYGEVDARAAVRLAENWITQQVAGNAVRASSPTQSGIIDLAIPEGAAPLVHRMDLALPELPGADLVIEHVEVRIRISHARPGDLTVRLISPTGTASILMDRPGRPVQAGPDELGDKAFADGQPTLDHVFTSARLRGERAAGSWTLEISDAVTGETGVLHEWSLNATGSVAGADDHFVYTDAFAGLAAQEGRNVLKDSGGGTDTINLAAMGTRSQVDLMQGRASLAGQALVIEQPGNIDNIIGGEFADTLIGNEHANILVGGGGSDLLSGEAGDDVIFVSRDGGSTVSGGAGRDVFVIERGSQQPWGARPADDVITDFTPGEDKLLMSGFTPKSMLRQIDVKIEGDDAVLHIYNGRRRIVLKNVSGTTYKMVDNWIGGLLFGYGHDDSVTVAAGLHARELTGPGMLYWGSDAADDIVATSSGTFWLGDAADRGMGALGDDVMHGGAGNDILFGDPVRSPEGLVGRGGDDVLYGDAGDDQLFGGAGNDILHGGAGRDILSGGDGDDVLHLEGDDALAGHARIDALYTGRRIRIEGGRAPDARAEGGEGGDHFVIAADTSDKVSSGLMKSLIVDFEVDNPEEMIDLSHIAGVRGFDDLNFSSLRYNRERYLRVWLGPARNGTQYFTLKDVDSWELDPTSFIFSDHAASPLRAPPPVMHGTAADDVVTGDDRANVINGGSGADRMSGRGGDDTYFVDNVADIVTEDVDGGYDHIHSAVSTNLPDNVEALTLLSRHGGNAPWFYREYAYGNAHATGNALDNAIDGDIGDNIIDGRAGADIMAGGVGDDSYIVDDPGDRVVEHEDEGRDTVKSSVSFLLDAHIERLELTGHDAINGCGNDLDNRIIGNLGDNRLLGGLGNDSIDGGAGADRLYGGGGNDRLVGAAGNDLLDGGTGNDLLIGEGGDDTYLLARGMGQDYVWEDDNVSGRADRILVGPGLSQQDIAVRRDGNDLLLLIAGSSEGMRVGNWFVHSRHQLSRVQFDDGSAWDRAALAARTQAASAGELLFGREWSGAIMAARAEVEQFRFNPFRGQDLIGRDSIYAYGTPVQDTIPFLAHASRGYCRDSSDEKITSTVDTIKIGAGYSGQELSLERPDRRSKADTGLQLKMQIGPQRYIKELVTVARGQDRLRIDFADGVLWDNATVREKIKPGVGRGREAIFTDGRVIGHNLWRGYDDASDVFLGGDHRDEMFGLQGEDHLDGGAGNDTLYGGGGNDVLVGGAGNDKLFGGDDDDLLDGGAGDDSLEGGRGNDTYLVYRGMGRDTVRDSNRHDNAANVIKVLDGVTPDDIVFSRDSWNLYMDIAGTSDRVKVGGMFGIPFEPITSMVFADGTRWDFRELERRSRTVTASEAADVLYGTEWFHEFNSHRAPNLHATNILGTDVMQGLGGNDTLVGYGANDLLDGGEGDDILRGDAGRDLLIGGRGNDVLFGCEEPDVIAFNRGDGRDRIETSYHFDRYTAEAGTPGTTLSLGGIAYAELALSRSEDDLVLDLGQDDSIRFGDWYKVWNSRLPGLNDRGKIVQRLQFVTETTDDYQAGADDPMHGKKVAWFDFRALVNKFDQAREDNIGLDRWSVAAALGQFHLRSSDTTAYGGELAYRYATQGDWRGMDPQMALYAVNQSGFGRTDKLIASQPRPDGYFFG